MPSIDGALLNGWMSTPLVLPAPVAGALAALLVVLLGMAFRGIPAGSRRLLLAVMALALAAFTVLSIADRIKRGEQAAERRALAQRSAQLAAQALAPGSVLACLDGAGGETVANGCEKIIFGGPQSTASAVAYMGARLTLLVDGLAFARHSDPGFAAALAPLRRAIELDRFGLAAHVLAVRDGCTAESCAAFALFDDTSVIKSNLRAQIFDQYVSRYAPNWNKSAPVAEKEAPASAPAVSAVELPAKTPAASHYDFPSAASIPPVSIMNAEPPLPKEAAEARAAQPAGERGTSLPVPLKRPQAQAASPPAR